MKITDIKVTHVNVPLDAPFWWTAGLYGGASKSIIEVETDEGVIGWARRPGGISARSSRPRSRRR